MNALNAYDSQYLSLNKFGFPVVLLYSEARVIMGNHIQLTVENRILSILQMLDDLLGR